MQLKRHFSIEWKSYSQKLLHKGKFVDNISNVN